MLWNNVRTPTLPWFYFFFFLSRQSKLSECGTHSRRAQLHGAEAKISDSVWIQVFNKDGTKKKKKQRLLQTTGFIVSEDPVEQTTGRRLSPSCCAHFTHRPLVIQAFAFSPEFTTKPETSMLGEPWEVCHMTNTGVLNLILLLSNNRLVNKRGNIGIRATACTQRSKSKVLK